MIRVDEIIPERVPDVGEVREFAEAVWRARSIDDQLQALLDDAMARLAAGENLNAVSESLPGSIVEPAILGRGESSGPFSQQVVQAAFFQGLNTPFEARASDPTTRMAAVVTDIIAPSAESFDPAGQIALSQELGDDITVALEAALFASYEVRRDQRLIDLALGRTDPENLP
jgi:peptidyl-prolyl cis-trans isomerase D